MCIVYCVKVYPSYKTIAHTVRHCINIMWLHRKQFFDFRVIRCFTSFFVFWSFASSIIARINKYNTGDIGKVLSFLLYKNFINRCSLISIINIRISFDIRFAVFYDAFPRILITDWKYALITMKFMFSFAAYINVWCCF